MSDRHRGPRVVAYVTDVEGNLDYFEQYIARSRVLRWKDERKSTLEFIEDNTEFVFGGDSQDKGIGDIRFVQLLLDLKKRHPERVHLIIGNRDANKLRFAAELAEETLEDEKVRADASFPYWVEEGKRVTPSMFLEKRGLADTAANRVRWMLKDTMGAEGDFERRKNELELLGGGKEVSEEDVAESFRREVDPNHEKDNFVLKYLEAGKLGHVFGRTLFVHGGVSEANMGYVPGREGSMGDARKWIEELNAWAQREVAAFKRNPHEGKNSKRRAGHGLMDYSVPAGEGKRGVILHNWLQKGNAAPIPDAVVQYLTASGIRTVVTGHIPHGDCPTVIRTGQLTVVMGDTSYSDMGHEGPWGKDNRGRAAHEILVYQDGRVEVHGVRADGGEVEYAVGMEEVDPESLVGYELEGGWWVKAKLKGGAERYVTCRGEGYSLTYEEKSAEQVRMSLKAGPNGAEESSLSLELDCMFLEEGSASGAWHRLMVTVDCPDALVIEGARRANGGVEVVSGDAGSDFVLMVMLDSCSVALDVPAGAGATIPMLVRGRDATGEVLSVGLSPQHASTVGQVRRLLLGGGAKECSASQLSVGNAAQRLPPPPPVDTEIPADGTDDVEVPMSELRLVKRQLEKRAAELEAEVSRVRAAREGGAAAQSGTTEEALGGELRDIQREIEAVARILQAAVQDSEEPEERTTDEPGQNGLKTNDGERGDQGASEAVPRLKIEDGVAGKASGSENGHSHAEATGGLITFRLRDLVESLGMEVKSTTSRQTLLEHVNRYCNPVPPATTYSVSQEWQPARRVPVHREAPTSPNYADVMDRFRPEQQQISMALHQVNSRLAMLPNRRPMTAPVERYDAPYRHSGAWRGGPGRGNRWSVRGDIGWRPEVSTRPQARDAPNSRWEGSAAEEEEEEEADEARCARQPQVSRRQLWKETELPLPWGAEGRRASRTDFERHATAGAIPYRAGSGWGDRWESDSRPSTASLGFEGGLELGGGQLRDGMQGAGEGADGVGEQLVRFEGLLEVYTVGSGVALNVGGGMRGGMQGEGGFAGRVQRCGVVETAGWGVEVVVELEMLAAMGEGAAGVLRVTVGLAAWEGLRGVGSLPLVPLSAGAMARLRSRGERFVRATRKREVMAHGARALFVKSRGGLVVHRRAGRVVVDAEELLECGGGEGWETRPGGASAATLQNEVAVVLEALGGVETGRFAGSVDGEEWERGVESEVVLHRVEVVSRVSTEGGGLAGREWSCLPVLPAFSLDARRWGYVAVDGVQEVEWDAGALDRMVLPSLHREVLSAIVAAKPWGGGWPGGPVVLYGPAGMGKRAAVAAVAEAARAPLVRVSGSRLGEGGEQAEERMSELLERCARWGAVLELEDAGCVVEGRESGVREMLREHAGLVVVTAAALAEVPEWALGASGVALAFDEGEWGPAMGEVWGRAVEGLGGGRLAGEELRELAESGFSVREVQRAVKLARAIASSQGGGAGRGGTGGEGLPRSALLRAVEHVRSEPRMLPSGNGSIRTGVETPHSTPLRRQPPRPWSGM